MTSNRIRGLFCAAALLLSVCADCVTATSYVAPPANIRDYLATSDLIVVGRIGRVHNVETFFGYGPPLVPPPPAQFGLPIVDYEILVDEVIQDDAEYPLSTRSPLLLRVLQTHATMYSPEVTKLNEGEFLLFLARNSDNATYGFYSMGHKVRLDDTAPEYLFPREYDFSRTPVTDRGFIAEVKQEAARLAPLIKLPIAGIWRDTAMNSQYYSVHEEGKRIVLVHMSDIGNSGDTLKSSYIGDRSDMVLQAAAPDASNRINYLQFDLQSADEALLYLPCRGCAPPADAVRIRRIF